MKEEACLDELLARPLKEDGFVALRGEAEARARALALPGAKHESWRLTDLGYLYGQSYSTPEGASSLPDIDAYRIAGTFRIVFVDGRYSQELSDLSDDDAVKIAPLGLEDQALHAYFGLSMPDDAFAQLNLRNFSDCAFVHVKDDSGRPIHVLFVSTRHDKPAACYARCLVVLEGGAQATLIEEYAGEGAYFCNAATEIVLKDHARLRHVRVQREGSESVHVGNTQVELGRGSNYDSTDVSLGGRLSRHFLHLSHGREGSEARLDGLSLTDGRRIADLHTKVDHLWPRCKTVQRHKCIASGSACAVFSGNIVVHKGASGTDTRQESRNLLLSGRAKIDAQPMLEILNDDVSCRHGATVGSLDMEALFYLKSRGLSEIEAKKLLIYAFASEILDRIPLPCLLESLKETWRLA